LARINCELWKRDARNIGRKRELVERYVNEQYNKPYLSRLNINDETFRSRYAR